MAAFEYDLGILGGGAAGLTAAAGAACPDAGRDCRNVATRGMGGDRIVPPCGDRAGHLLPWRRMATGGCGGPPAFSPLHPQGPGRTAGEIDSTAGAIPRTELVSRIRRHAMRSSG